MVTCFRVVTNRPSEHLNLHVSSVSPLLKSYRYAFSDPNWQNAMRDEYHSLIKNKTSTLVPRPPDTNNVCCSSQVYGRWHALSLQGSSCGEQLLLGMWCMYDAYNEHGDYPVARLEIDSFDETAHVVIVIFDETSEE
nr:ribonuclease H-like domain-containing protein [Tanacetum cinerariifolium]